MQKVVVCPSGGPRVTPPIFLLPGTSGYLNNIIGECMGKVISLNKYRAMKAVAELRPEKTFEERINRIREVMIRMNELRDELLHLDKKERK